MSESELVSRVSASTGLSRAEAARVVDDVVAFYAESMENFVRRRHRDLQTYGMKNPEIWAQIAAELSGRVVAAPELSSRQLRRVVYG